MPTTGISFGGREGTSAFVAGTVFCREAVFVSRLVGVAGRARARVLLFLRPVGFFRMVLAPRLQRPPRAVYTCPGGERTRHPSEPFSARGGFSRGPA